MSELRLAAPKLWRSRKSVHLVFAGIPHVYQVGGPVSCRDYMAACLNVGAWLAGTRL